LPSNELTGPMRRAMFAPPPGEERHRPGAHHPTYQGLAMKPSRIA
jgi:hypothetical protein